MTRLILLCFGVMVLLWGFVFWQSYDGRTNLVTNSRAQCEYARLDRNANAIGWRAAEVARLTALSNDELHIPFDEAKKLVFQKPNINDPFDLVAARTYDSLAAGQEKRSRIDCKIAFPKASLIP